MCFDCCGFHKLSKEEVNRRLKSGFGPAIPGLLIYMALVAIITLITKNDK